MFIPNTPQWWVIWLTFIFSLAMGDQEGFGSGIALAMVGVLILWGMEGRRRKREGR